MSDPIEAAAREIAERLAVSYLLNGEDSYAKEAAQEILLEELRKRFPLMPDVSKPPERE
jgi:hypothetical protein